MEGSLIGGGVLNGRGAEAEGPVGEDSERS